MTFTRLSKSSPWAPKEPDSPTTTTRSSRSPFATASGSVRPTYCFSHHDYEWHDIGKLWQTPGEGEAFVEAQNAMAPNERAELFEAIGVPPAGPLEMAEAADATMGASILGLYRSALPNPHAAWGPWSPTVAPGLVLKPTEDAFGNEAMAREVAMSLGARFEPIEGAGHFWPYQAPAAGAAILESFWSSLD